MNHQSSAPDLQYLQAFQCFDIDVSSFHHREHLRIAYTLLTVHDPETALNIMRQSILALLEHLGAGSAKYHETLTVAWMLAVHHFMKTTPACDSFDRFITVNDVLLEQQLMSTHYSHDLLGSAGARQEFKGPDIEVIPLHGIQPDSLMSHQARAQ